MGEAEVGDFDTKSQMSIMQIEFTVSVSTERWGSGAPAKIFGHQDIAGLDVTVYNGVVVRNSHAQSYLCHYVDHFPERES